MNHGYFFQLTSWSVRWRELLVCLVILLFGLIAYSNSFAAEFVYDDSMNIVSNQAIKDTTNISSIWSIYPRRFITNLSFALNYAFFGLNVFDYHLINFLIHLFNAWLVYMLIKNLLQLHWFIPLFAALLFISHPVQTQAVTFISQRATILATFFYLSSMLFYIKSRRIKLKSFSRFFYITSLLLTIFAFFTKEISFTLVLSITLIELIFIKKKRGKKNILSILPFYLLTVIIFVAFYLIPSFNILSISTILPIANQKLTITRLDYLVTQINVVATYIRLLFLPVGQNLDYDFPVSHSLLTRPTFLNFLSLSSLFFLSIFWLKKAKLFSFGILFFFISLAVESTLIPIADLISEHRLYLPSIGFFLAISSLLSCLFNYLQKKFSTNKFYYSLYSLSRLLVILIIITIFVISTYKRNFVWQNEFTLWTDVVKKSPNKTRGHYNLGVASYSKGNIQQAKEEFEKTIVLDKSYKEAYHNLAVIYEREGKLIAAEEIYLQALKVDDQYFQLRNSLGSLYTKMNRFTQAEKEFQFIIKINPQYAQAYNNLGVIYLSQNLPEKALPLFHQAIKLNSFYEEAYYNLADLYFQQEKYDQAYQTILELSQITNDKQKTNSYLSIISQKLGR